MNINIEIASAREYFEGQGLEIDWDGNDSSKIPLKQANALDKIITTEVGIHVLRRVTGVDGWNADIMVEIRRGFINAYEKEFGKYNDTQDFW